MALVTQTLRVATVLQDNDNEMNWSYPAGSVLGQGDRLASTEVGGEGDRVTSRFQGKLRREGMGAPGLAFETWDPPRKGLFSPLT